MENKSVKFWKFFAIVLIVLNLTLIGFLLLRPIGGRRSEVKVEVAMGNYFVEKLKLTAPQQRELKRLRENHHAAILALQAEGKKLRKRFFDGLISDTAKSKEDSIANEIAGNQKQIELMTYSHFQEVKKICTEEQKLIFDDIIQDVLEKMSKPRQSGDRRMHPKPQQ
jgi:hypothetical protein